MRFVVAMILQLYIANCYIARVNLSLALTRMARPSNISEEDHSCPIPEGYHNVSNSDEKIYDYHWNPTQQQYILSSFYIGYFITHIPGGALCDTFGARWVLLISMIGTTIITVLTPTLADWGWIPLMLARSLMGFVQVSIVVKDTFFFKSKLLNQDLWPFNKLSV